MATTVRRATALDPTQAFREHIIIKREASTLTTRANAMKDRLKKWFLESPSSEVYENEQGSKFFDFDQTISDGKDDYKGMELRRSVTTKFDEEVAERILRAKNVYDEATTPVLDQDKIFRLVQEGKITEKDIDKMFIESESFAFWALKGEVLD